MNSDNNSLPPRRRIGITGQAGFIGTHLFNHLSLFPEKYQLQPFEDSYFNSDELLQNWVRNCDVIVHLAAMNRHGNPDVIYQTNIKLVRELIGALEKTGSSPHIIFSSSTQEERDNGYGRSKKEGRELFLAWANKFHGKFTGLVIPNVFGPFGNPYYNSVIATFCHQLTHNEIPRIDVDGMMQLIYVGDLVQLVQSAIDNNILAETFHVPAGSEHRVSSILGLLMEFKTGYYEKGIIPSFADTFELKLFNTFCCYMDIGKRYPALLTPKSDERGSFVEVVRTGTAGQTSFSTTKPGVTRGNHFHTRKIERFAVISGDAIIQLRRIGTREVFNFTLSGNTPSYVDMPIWFTHNITNTGNGELLTAFWINESFDPTDPDSFSEKV